MRGNSFGKMISLVSFGESHGRAMGAVVDGIPAGLDFCLEDLQEELDRRAPGRLAGTTRRREPDRAEVLSGIFEGQTLGTPIAVIVYNRDAASSEYAWAKAEDRPGHADRTTLQKYGRRDWRGGGRASGRETLARVIGGYLASLVIPQVLVRAYTSRLGPFSFAGIPADIKADFGAYAFPDRSREEAIANYLLRLQEAGDSCGGKVAMVVDNCPEGLGEPAFDKLKADLSKAFLSIGGAVAFSYGLGEQMIDLSGSEVSSDRSSFGGIEGGISNGGRMTLQVTFKPPSTVGEKARRGRHDPCIVPRAIPVVEAMAKLVLADHFLRQRAYAL